MMNRLFKAIVLIVIFGFTFVSQVEAAKIRQEIPIIMAQTAASATGMAAQQIINTNIYGGTATYAFEAVGDYATAGTITLRLASDNSVAATLTWSSTETTPSRKRVSFTPTAGANAYYVYLGASGTAAGFNTGRILVFQDTSGFQLTSTETQIEIGDYETAMTNTSSSPLTAPKYWTYTAANWDGTLTYSAEATYSTSTTNLATITLQEDDGSWNFSNKVTMVNGVSSVGATLSPRVIFTPTNGRHYRIAAFTNSGNYTIYNAKIIVTQTGTISKLEPQYLLMNTKNVGTTAISIGNTSVSGAASVSVVSWSHTVTGVNRLLMVSVGFRNYTTVSSVTYGGANLTHLIDNASGSGNFARVEIWYLLNPNIGTDTISVNLVSADYVSVGGVTFNVVDQSSPLGVGATNSGVGVSNASVSVGSSVGNIIYDAVSFWASGGSWVPGIGETDLYDATADNAWRVSTGVKNGLASNTGVGWTFAGTVSDYAEAAVAIHQSVGIPVTDKTLWDATEWSGVTNVYKHAVDSIGVGSSTQLVDVGNSNTVVTNSKVSGVGQTISNNLTMPTSGHEIDSWILGSGEADASRILVQVSIAPMPTKVVFTNSPRTLTAGSCNGAASVLTIQLQDGSNNPTSPTGASVIRVTSDSSDYTIYSDNTCSTQVTNGDFTFTTADNTMNVYIINRKTPNWTMTAHKQSGPDNIADGTQGITVNPGVLYQYLVNITSPQVVNTCFNGINNISAQDQWGNVRTTDTSVVNMTTTGSSMTFYTTAGCSGATSQYTMSSGTGTMYVKTSAIQSGITVTATRNGGTETGTTGLINVKTSTVNIQIKGGTKFKGGDKLSS